MRRPSPIFFLLPLFLLLAGSLAASDRPPQHLHMVGDHWTAWNPPEEFPEGAQLYTIVRGDTLWALAARFYGDPYLWPQLWERNRYIQDAHWIYPGDPLVVDVKVKPVESLTELEGGPKGAEPEGEKPEGSHILTAQEAAGAPSPLGSESDIYCSGYVGGLNEAFPFKIVGSEYEALTPNLSGQAGSRIQGLYGSADTVKYDLDTGDVVYLDGGRAAGLSPGDEFSVVAAQQKVTHPVSGRVVGRLYRYLGRVRVLSVQDTTAIAEIVQSCAPVIVGSSLKPFEPEPVPLGRDTQLRPINLPVSADKLVGAPVILLAKDDLVSLGQDQVVYIDRGADADVVPGDIYTIYRANRPGLPPVVLGELAVLSVHETSSVARIIKSRYTIYVGDRLDPR